MTTRTSTSKKKKQRDENKKMHFYFFWARRDEARSGGCGAVACEPAGGGIGVGACRR